MYTINNRCLISIVAVSILLLSDKAVLFAGENATDIRFDAIDRKFVSAMDNHDAAGAKTLAYQMIALKPKCPRGLRNLCFADEALHNYKAAIADINAALKLQKDDPRYLCLRARIYAESDQDNLAKLDFEKAITTDHESADFYRQAAFSLERLEDYESAFAAIQKALKLKPDNGDIQKIAGRVLERLKRPQEAEEHLRKACLLMPGKSEPLRYLAMVHVQLKRPDAVVADTTGAIKAGDVRGMNLVELYRVRAEALTTLGRLQEARQDYDHCITLSPLQRSLFQARARLNQKLGDAKGADRDLAKVKSLDSSLQPFNGF
jgi:tetratricopeptide (TPR) repeat protein